MDTYRALVYVHVVCSVVLTGLALFWFIMRLALRQRFGEGEARDLLQIANRARWPHVAVPYALRLPLPWVAWVILGLLVASGLIIFQVRGGAGALWWVKMALVAVIVGIQLLVTPRPVPKLIGLNLALVLAAILVSGWMIR